MESLDVGPSVRITQPKDPTKGLMTSEEIGAQIPLYKEEFIRSPSMEVTHFLAPVIAKHTTHNEKPAVIVNAFDYYGGHDQVRCKVEARRKAKQDAEKDEKQKDLQSNKEEGIMQDQEIDQEDKDGFTEVKNKKKRKTATQQPQVKLTKNNSKRKVRN
ncbi:hypothetical protein FXO37_14340 [Capsicum annuum]|nr:hypothetical protein FXO37_14340 [Capsicum annuum]